MKSENQFYNCPRVTDPHVNWRWADVWMTHQYVNFHVGDFSLQWPMCSPLSSSGCPFPVAVLLGDSICGLVNIESEHMGGLLIHVWRNLAPCPCAIGWCLSVTVGMSAGLGMSLTGHGPVDPNSFLPVRFLLVLIALTVIPSIFSRQCFIFPKYYYFPVVFIDNLLL